MLNTVHSTPLISCRSCVVPPCALPFCLSRVWSLGVVSDKIQIGVEIMAEAVRQSNPRLARYINFPFWSTDPSGNLGNCYLQYSPPFSIKHWFYKMTGMVDGLIAVYFRPGGVVVVMSQLDAGVALGNRSFNLSDPGSFRAMGDYIFKLLARA